jgi:hypothetical protein
MESAFPYSLLIHSASFSVQKLTTYSYFNVKSYRNVGEILRCGIHKLINSICSKEELPDQWKKSIIVPVNMMGDITDCSTYHGLSLLLTS